MLLELRYALRRLRTSPGFTLTAIATLALAIGTTSAMVGVLDAVLLRRLPFPSPDRLVVLWHEMPSQGVREARSAFGTVDEWRRQSRSLEDIAILDPVSAMLDRGGEIEQVSGARVSPNLFALLGVAPARGRLFTDREASERQRVALISHRFWQARFAASAAAIGATVLVDGQASQIVGVLPAALADAGFPADIWEPHTAFADWDARRVAVGRGSWFVFGRLRGDGDIGTAQRELAAIGRRLDMGQPDADAGRTVRVVPLREQLAGVRSSAVAWTLGGAALLLWLVAAVNVAGLTIARGLGRLPQLALQAALGASRSRLVRSLLVETGAVAVLAGLAGLGVAAGAAGAIRAFGPSYVPRLADVHLDVRVLAWAAALSALTAVVIGLTPALAAWRRDLRVTSVDGGRRASAGAASRVRRLFVAAECAIAVVLLAGGGLFLRSWWNVSRVDPGFQADRVVSLNVAPPAGMPAAQRAAFYDAVLERASAVPGVERAGISSEWFVGAVREQPIVAEGGERAGAQLVPLRRDEIAGDVFDTLETRVLAGRVFTSADGRSEGLVAIVNAAMASRLWPGRDAIGRRFAFGQPGAASRWFTVVGVVADMRRQGLEIAPVPQMFEPVAQAPSNRVILLARTSPGAPGERRTDPLALAAGLRAAVRGVDAKAVVYRAGLVSERLGVELGERRVQAALLLACALVTLLLATLGLYALIQHSVVARTHEIGVRLALGARPADIGRMVAGEGLLLALAGLALGLAGSWWLARAASSLLFGVGAADPPTLLAVSVLAIAVAAGASYLPARRATRIAPIVALRRRTL
jgi:putative ABC transport system permease protein